MYAACEQIFVKTEEQMIVEYITVLKSVVFFFIPGDEGSQFLSLLISTILRALRGYARPGPPNELDMQMHIGFCLSRSVCSLLATFTSTDAGVL